MKPTYDIIRSKTQDDGFDLVTSAWGVELYKRGIGMGVELMLVNWNEDTLVIYNKDSGKEPV